MATRKLVEIDVKKHKLIEQLRARCKKAKGWTPSVPFIVDLALQNGLPAALAKLEPTED